MVKNYNDYKSLFQRNQILMDMAVLLPYRTEYVNLSRGNEKSGYYRSHAYNKHARNYKIVYILMVTSHLEQNYIMK